MIEKQDASLNCNYISEGSILKSLITLAWQ